MLKQPPTPAQPSNSTTPSESISALVQRLNLPPYWVYYDYVIYNNYPVILADNLTSEFDDEAIVIDYTETIARKGEFWGTCKPFECGSTCPIHSLCGNGVNIITTLFPNLPQSHPELLI